MKDKSDVIKAIVIGVLVFWVGSFVFGAMTVVYEHNANKNIENIGNEIVME